MFVNPTDCFVLGLKIFAVKDLLFAFTADKRRKSDCKTLRMTPFMLLLTGILPNITKCKPYTITYKTVWTQTVTFGVGFD